MPTRKKAIRGVVQGYTGTQLRDDLATLAGLRTEIVYADGAEYEYDEDVTKLIVGRACANVRTAVDKSLAELFVKLTDLLPDNVVKTVTRYDAQGASYQAPVAELQYKMGPLKKVSRITEKAAHYAICSDANPDALQLQQVRDILRATMVFPPAAWGEKKDRIGSKMIDTVNQHFGGAVVQVKNRFIHDHYPNFAQLDGVKLPKDLKQFVDGGFKQTVWGRDSFYRDLQLLVRLDNTAFANGVEMTHTILELQLASSLMYSGKTDKSTKGGSGHDMYKNVRAAMEYCEYLWWRERRKNNGVTIALANAATYYNVAGINMAKFAEQAEAMARLYQHKDIAGMEGVLANAIDDSEWAKSF